MLLLMTVLLAGACGRGPSAAPTRRGDPGVRVAAAVLALERSGEHRLSAQQARQILPLLKVLRDTRPEDREASQALADQVMATLTPAQRAASDRLREQAQERFAQRGQGGAPLGVGGPGAGEPAPGDASLDPARRAEFRRRALDRAIRLLQPKAR